MMSRDEMAVAALVHATRASRLATDGAPLDDVHRHAHAAQALAAALTATAAPTRQQPAPIGGMEPDGAEQRIADHQARGRP